MNDEYVLSRLRAADSDGAAPTHADVAAAAALGRRLRRRRHALAGAGAASALSLASIAALVLMPNGGSAVFQETLPAVGSGAEPGTGAEVGGDWTDPYELLREALGPGDWAFGRTGGGDRVLVLDPDSRFAAGLPDGYPAHAEINVRSTGPGTLSACDSPPQNPRYFSCVVRKHGDGELRISRHLFISDERAASATTFVDYFRPDGVQVSAWIDVDPPRGSTSGDGRRQAEAWIPQFEDELITAAADPRAEVDPAVMAKENARTVQLDASDANAALLRGTLGEDWTLTTAAFGGLRTAKSTSLRLNSPTHDALPSEWHVWASLTDSPTGLSAENPCGNTSERSLGFKACTPRTLPDGRVVLIGRAHGTTDNGQFAAEGLRVIYSRPDGTLALAQLVVVHDPKDVTVETRQQVQTWLDPFEDKLIAAAISSEVELVPEADPSSN